MDSDDIPENIADELEEISGLLDESFATRTLKTYGYKWNRYSDYCEDQGVQALPSHPGVVSAYLLTRSKKWTTQTVQGDRLAISWKHRSSGYDDPTDNQLVSRTMRAVHQRADPNEGSGKMHALLTEDIKKMIDSLLLDAPSNEGVWEKAMRLRALRDQALILLGFAAALRASEIAGVQAKDFEFNQEGMELHLSDTKTNVPRIIGVSRVEDVRYCPVRSLKRWTSSADITSGPVFRRVHNSAQLGDHEIDRRTVWRIIKGTAKDAEIDDADQVGAHSVRRGHATQAALNDVPLERLRRQLGHKDPATTAGYIQDARRMQEETSQELGL